VIYAVTDKTSGKPTLLVSIDNSGFLLLNYQLKINFDVGGSTINMDF